MKRLKKIIANLMALLLIGVFCFTFTACSDIRALKITVSVYSEDEGEMVEKDLTLNLYRHLAPNTVDTIIKYAKEGYYNDVFFYQTGFYIPQIYVGDLKFDNNSIISNSVKPEITGEFEFNGHKGSNLLSKEGSVGLWRSWASDETYDTTNLDAFNSGRATWFMPIQENQDENGFCIFAQFDTSSEAWELIKNVLSNPDYYENYTIYYTGDYTEDSVNNHGLTFNYVLSSEFNNLPQTVKDDIFVAGEGQLVCYNSYSIKAPVYYNADTDTNEIGAKIVRVSA